MDAGRLILAAALPAGAVLGALLWMLFGAPSRALADLQADADRLAAAGLGAPRQVSLDRPVAQSAAQPLFALTTGPGAVADVTVTLEGLARSPRAASALIAINGGVSAWLDLGKTRDGVTLMEVLPSRVVLLTPLGRKEVALGETPPASGAAGPPAQSSEAAPAGGFRMPPAPADAPGAP